MKHFGKKALDVSITRQETVMLDAFSEALQEWYENKLKEGDIAGDAEWMKKLYDDVKMIYEATSEKTLPLGYHFNRQRSDIYEIFAACNSN
jgi:hypothetical protein